MHADWNFIGMQYGAKWREQRRLFQNYFHAGNIQNYQPQEIQNVSKMLERLLDTPEDFMAHIRQYVHLCIL